MDTFTIHSNIITNRNTNFNSMKKRLLSYTAPKAETLKIMEPLSILSRLSAQGSFRPIEDGGEFDFIDDSDDFEFPWE